MGKMDKNTTKISPESFILALANDGKCYDMFIENCWLRLRTGEWRTALIIATVQGFFDRAKEPNEKITFPAATNQAARDWLNMRYHEHFLRKIFPTYATIAKNSLESWNNTPKSMKFAE